MPYAYMVIIVAFLSLTVLFFFCLGGSSGYVLLCFAMFLLCICFVLLFFTIFHYFLLFFAMFCYVFAMLCYVLLCFAMFLLCFCYVLLCLVMFCYAFAMFLLNKIRFVGKCSRLLASEHNGFFGALGVKYEHSVTIVATFLLCVDMFLLYFCLFYLFFQYKIQKTYFYLYFAIFCY